MPLTRSAPLRFALTALALAATSAAHAVSVVGLPPTPTFLPSRSTPVYTFVISRSGDSNYAVTVRYTTKNGTALAGRDYVATTGVATIPAGQFSASVRVPLLPVVAKQARSFQLVLSDPQADAPPPFAWSPVASVSNLGISVGSATADFNGDGKPDAAFAAYGDAGQGITVVRNDTAKGATSGNFAVATILPATSPSGIATADLNGDGKPDLIASNVGLTDDGHGVLEFYINTTPTFAPNFSFEKSSLSFGRFYANWVTTADVDGDGQPDVIASSPQLGVIVLLNRTPKGATKTTFAPPLLLPIADIPFRQGGDPYAYAITTLDYDSDGRPDIAVTDLDLSTIVVFRNTTPKGASAATFAPRVSIPLFGGLEGGATGLATGDIDGDGRPDLVTAEGGSNSDQRTWSVLLNRTPAGSTVPNFVKTSFFDGPTPYNVFVKDIDGDGKPDVVFNANSDFAGQSTGSGVAVYLNHTEKGSDVVKFDPLALVPGGDNAFLAQSLVIADFNSDGRWDFGVASAFYVPGAAEFFFGIPTDTKDVRAVIGTGASTSTAVIAPHFGLINLP